MRVLVTGGTGFLGAQVVRECLAAGHDVAVLARRNLADTRLAGEAARLPAITADLDRADGFADAVAHFRPTALVHAAWWGVSGAQRNDPRQLDNVAATAKVADAALAAGASIILGLGSQAEYGPVDGPAAEDLPPRPTTLYGVAKVAACGMLLQKAEAAGQRGVWGRVYSLYGPGDDGPALVPMLGRSLRAGQPPELTDCEQLWEFTHVRDAATAVLALIEAPGATGIFNIGSGRPVQLREAVLAIRDLLRPGLEPLFGRQPYRPDQVMHLEADIGRIRTMTGWSPKIELLEGLADTFHLCPLELAS